MGTCGITSVSDGGADDPRMSGNSALIQASSRRFRNLLRTTRPVYQAAETSLKVDNPNLVEREAGCADATVQVVE